MIESMTGFGLGTAREAGFRATVELKSVNHRHCQVVVQAPEALSSYEYELETTIKEAFERGRISAYIQIEHTDEAGALQIDTGAARGYTRLLERLRDAAGLEEQVTLSHLLTFSDLFTPALSRKETAEKAWETVSGAMGDAIQTLRKSRREEGCELQKDLFKRADAIEELLGYVEDRAPERVDEARARLTKRVDGLLEDRAVNEERLEHEIVLLADKMDITEECVRLHSHLKFFREALDQSEPAGRRLKFLAQEMHREINTIGSKSNDADIAQKAVQMKEEVEKIREQIRNVE